MGEPIAEMEFGLSNDETLEALKPDIIKNNEEREADLLKKKSDMSALEPVQENIFGNTNKESNSQQINETKAEAHMNKKDEMLSSADKTKTFPASFFEILMEINFEFLPVKQIAEIDFGASSTHALETLEAMKEDIKKRNEEAERDPTISAIHHLRDDMPYKQ
uniref:Uncharacterized protein n=1 Tax=Panagrolaimus davidi TaxID=227884 RepID=A0A914PIA8_9BILA